MAAPIPPGYPPNSDLEIVSQLEGMGFSRDLAEQAVAGTEGGSLQAALDWLVQLCQTPRAAAAMEAEPSAAVAVESLARSSEEEELSRAIHMSLTVQSPAQPPVVAREPSEEEELEAAIAASLSDLQQDTARAIEQVESYQMGEAQRHSMLARLPPPEVLSPPPIRRDPVLELSMVQALHSRAPQAMQIAKAALILRRRAASARLRVEDRKLLSQAAAPPPDWPPADRSESQRPAAPPVAPRVVGKREGEGGEGEGAHERRIMAGTKLLGERLISLGLRRIAAADDGNCQFRALSQQLYGSEEFHASVRRDAVAHMRREASFFGAMFEASDFEAYLADMRRSKTWGDELTLRAVADALACVVHVVTSNEANWYLQYVPTTEPTEQKQKHVFLTYVAPVHYDALTLL